MVGAGPGPARDGLAGTIADGSGVSPSSVRYGYVVDGDERLLPDPRSRRQPDGVHAMSATFDPGGVRVDRSAMGRAAAGRRRHLRAAHRDVHRRSARSTRPIDRLDHLVDLGVDFVEVLPVNAFNGARNWGYDGVLWFAVDESYGGPEAYQRFVDACHRRRLGVIQDVVYNHLGPSGNYLPVFGPYLRDTRDQHVGCVGQLRRATRCAPT